MATAALKTVILPTMGGVLDRLGNISPHRVLIEPLPGKATEEDLVRLHTHTDRIFELIDGTLVEKTMGFLESALAFWLGHLLQRFLEGANLGILVGADGAMRFLPGLVRVPDVSFIRWEKLPGRRVPRTPLPDFVPNLAVEVLSQSNTKGEMDRKRQDYFRTGVELVWFVDPEKRTATVYTSSTESTVLTEDDTLDGGSVLPGFTVPVRRIFAMPEAPEPSPAPQQSAPKQKPSRKRKR
jgi:Uma2 family endonuclease